VTILWSNWLVGSITAVALALLFWPLWQAIVGRRRRAVAGQA